MSETIPAFSWEEDDCPVGDGDAWTAEIERPDLPGDLITATIESPDETWGGWYWSVSFDTHEDPDMEIDAWPQGIAATRTLAERACAAVLAAIWTIPDGGIDAKAAQQAGEAAARGDA